MTRRQRIDSSREVRLWLKEVVIPGAAIVASVMAIPEVREPMVRKINATRESIKRKFKKDRDSL